MKNVQTRKIILTLKLIVKDAIMWTKELFDKECETE